MSRECKKKKTNVHVGGYCCSLSYICRWRIYLNGPEKTLYQGEKFVLQFKFSESYPFDSPQVNFCCSSYICG